MTLKNLLETLETGVFAFDNNGYTFGFSNNIESLKESSQVTAFDMFYDVAGCEMVEEGKYIIYITEK